MNGSSTDGITEAHNGLGWKESQRSSCPTPLPTVAPTPHSCCCGSSCHPAPPWEGRALGTEMALCLPEPSIQHWLCWETSSLQELLKDFGEEQIIPTCCGHRQIRANPPTLLPGCWELGPRGRSTPGFVLICLSTRPGVFWRVKP